MWGRKRYRGKGGTVVYWGMGEVVVTGESGENHYVLGYGGGAEKESMYVRTGRSDKRSLSDHRTMILGN